MSHVPFPDFPRYMVAVRTVAGQLKRPTCPHPECSCRYNTSGTSCLGQRSLLCKKSPHFDRHRGETSVPILLIWWAGCELRLKEERKMKKRKKAKSR